MSFCSSAQGVPEEQNQVHAHLFGPEFAVPTGVDAVCAANAPSN
jgi:hypothetical protein